MVRDCDAQRQQAPGVIAAVGQQRRQVMPCHLVEDLGDLRCGRLGCARQRNDVARTVDQALEDRSPAAARDATVAEDALPAMDPGTAALSAVDETHAAQLVVGGDDGRPAHGETLGETALGGKPGPRWQGALRHRSFQRGAQLPVERPPAG